MSDTPRDLFDEASACFAPDRLLSDPRATGEGVRVCVIDTGVERQLLEEKFARLGRSIETIRGALFTPERQEPLPYDGHQSSPHGTTVADILLTVAPRVQLFSADVFGPRGSCEVEVLIRALRWAVDVWRCKVINLSLGVPEQRLQQAQKRLHLQRAVEEAYYKDVLVIAAAHNDHPLTRSYPAAFAPPLLSVDKTAHANPLRCAYNLYHQVEFQAHGRGYLGPFAHEPATSWAAPHLSGIVARILSLRPNLKPFEMKTILYWLGSAPREEPRTK